MASFEKEFLLDTMSPAPQEETSEAPLSFEEEWERFQEEERRFRAQGQAALFAVTRVEGEPRVVFEEV